MIGKLPSGKYRVRVKHRGKVVASKSFARLRDAQRWEDEQRRRIDLGVWVDPRRGERLVADVASEWLASRRGQVSSSTWTTDKHFVTHLTPALGNLPIGQVTRARIESALGELISAGRARSSVQRLAAVLSGIFVYAVREQIIVSNPCAGVRVPPGAGKPPRSVLPLSRDELHEVVAAQRAFSRSGAAVTLFLGLTGLRWGELRSLRVADVQQAPVPAVRISVSHSDGHAEKVPKGRRRRLVPLVPEAWSIVEPLLDGRSPRDYVFTSPQGGQLNESNWKRSIRWESTAMGRRVHDLRHTFATLALQGGLDVKTVQAWLGHASATLTLDLYGHFMTTDADRAAVDRLARHLAAGDTMGTREGVEAVDRSEADRRLA
jgi:integrase